ncbi:hypothetical protein [Treponema sp. Marseille-Q3903]|uniref:hypothetical protein n=1 Tax=Treponema sp. Marseille-Q3903 TaxID=2766703 RepID=UPI0016521E0F|nr:hypothetical protein [Treponema sp. Marseille-Q3903]MBC6714257.1 hypothetical protein [Treponema sp. Marseille-Q3903]
MSEELDPDIAAILSSAENYTNQSALELSFSKNSEPMDDEQSSKKKSIHNVDLSVKEFAPITKFTNDTPSDVFNDTKYYKIALTGENQSAQRVHQVLSKYLTCQDPKDRAVYRQQIVTAYWELLRGMVGKMNNPNVPMPKRMLVRFGVLLPSLFKQESKEFFSKIFVENIEREPILYVDEWFNEIASGRMGNSATDEKRQTKTVNMTPDQAASAEQIRLMQLQSKNSGKLQSAENLLSIKENERSMLEAELKNKIDDLCDHQTILGLEPHRQGYSEMQRRSLSDITALLHRLSKNDKELSKVFEEFKESKETFNSLENKINASGTTVAATNDTEAVKIEFETVRQMAKMTIGRRGNQFPIFTREFYHCTERGTGSRENVIDVLRWVESLDPGAFQRIHKNIPNRIVPYVLLVPTYGDRGFCWEPFDRYNRVTSRGRIVVPMYPKDLKIAVLTAVADLRWQVAKEKASYYWMEEGLTGQYYQHVEQLKLKGDLKEFFIEDYILWMTKESSGVQRLDKDVRGIFWRNMPFPKTLKEDLRRRSLVYDELCKKDANREMSDGY